MPETQIWCCFEARDEEAPCRLFFSVDNLPETGWRFRTEHSLLKSVGKGSWEVVSQGKGLSTRNGKEPIPRFLVRRLSGQNDDLPSFRVVVSVSFSDLPDTRRESD